MCVFVCVCVSGRGALLRWRFGRGAGGGGRPRGSTGKGGRSAKEEIEEINKAAFSGAVHRSVGPRSVGLLGQEKRCFVVCGAEPQSGQVGDGALPTLWR